MKNIKEQRGLTLIEVMITLVILAILTAVAIPAYNGYIATAREAEGNNNLAALALAEEEYFLENNSYFAGTSTAQLMTNSGGLWSATGTDGVINFTYEVTATASGFTAKARGAGGKVPTTKVLTLSK